MNKKILNFIASLFFGVCIFININIFGNQSLKFINIIGLFITTILSYIFINKKSAKVHPLKLLLSFIFGFSLILSECYITSDGLALINNNIGTLILTIIKIFGYTYTFKNIFVIIDKYFYHFDKKNSKKLSKSRFIKCLESHPFLTSFITILVAWSIYLIAFYPIVLSPDPANQIKMYFNVETHYALSSNLINPNVLLTAHHPVLHTYLLGISVSFGKLIGNDNLGLFIYTLCQTTMLAGVLAYSIKVLKQNSISNKYLLIILLIYSFVPMYPFYAIAAVKDTLYTIFMILFVLFIFNIVKNNKTLNIKELLYLLFLSLIISMLRNNGVYVVLLTLIFVIPYNKVNLKKLIITTLTFMVIFGLYDKVLIPSLDITPTSLRETLSIPFQQTARLVKYYPDFYNKDEEQIIDKVIDYKILKDKYNPVLSDPVKNTYRKTVKNKDLVAYFKVWLKGLVHHPILYIDATLNNTYGFISPIANNWYIYYKFDKKVTENNLVDYHYNNLGFLRKILAEYGKSFKYIPIIGLLSNIGFGTWIILTFSVYLLLSKKKKYLHTLVPLYGTLIFCFLGPANTYFRYAMPYLFVLPVLCILLLNEVRE